MARKLTREERLASDALIEGFSGKPRRQYLECNGKRMRLEPVTREQMDRPTMVGYCPTRRLKDWAKRAGLTLWSPDGWEIAWSGGEVYIEPDHKLVSSFESPAFDEQHIIVYGFFGETLPSWWDQ